VPRRVKGIAPVNMKKTGVPVPAVFFGVEGILSPENGTGGQVHCPGSDSGDRCLDPIEVINFINEGKMMSDVYYKVCG
jgi:hypothetical protein